MRDQTPTLGWQPGPISRKPANITHLIIPEGGVIGKDPTLQVRMGEKPGMMEVDFWLNTGKMPETIKPKYGEPQRTYLTDPRIIFDPSS